LVFIQRLQTSIRSVWWVTPDRYSGRFSVHNPAAYWSHD